MPEQQLYRVYFDSEVFVVAESEIEAEIYTMDHWSAISNDAIVDVSASVAKSIPKDWQTSLPYNDETETTCGIWMERMKAAAEAAAKAKAEFDAHPALTL